MLFFPKVLGWILIAAVTILLLIFTSVTRCLSPISFMQLKFWKIYLEQEQQILKSQATEHAMQLAKENIKCFFERSHPKEYNTPSIKDWQQISSLYTFNPKDQYYSLLHKYVNRKEKSQSIRSSEGDVVVPVLGFVDSPGINTSAELWPYLRIGKKFCFTFKKQTLVLFITAPPPPPFLVFQIVEIEF